MLIKKESSPLPCLKPKTAKVTVKRFANIDALRGIAALLVVWLHVAEVFVILPGVASQGTAWYDFADLLGLGRTGVIAFFAISGYVVVPTIGGARLTGSRDFILKRCLRLFPPFWFSITVSAVSIWAVFDRGLTVPIFIANMTMIPLEFGKPQMMGQLWTLEVELIFYALILLLFWLQVLARQSVIALFLVAISVAWPLLSKTWVGREFLDHNLVWSYLSYFISVMFWGGMLRNYDQKGDADFDWYRDWPLVVATSLVFGRPLIAIIFGSPFVHREDWNGSMLGLLLFVAFVRLPSWVGRPFAGLGVISYSLYLLHPAVFYPLYHYLSNRPDVARLSLGSYILLSMVISVFFAFLSYLFVERPFINLSQLLVLKLHLKDRLTVSH